MTKNKQINFSGFILTPKNKIKEKERKDDIDVIKRNLRKKTDTNNKWSKLLFFLFET